jgi:hypothetical protein
MWLDLWNRAAESRKERGWRTADRGRFAAYLRLNLAALDGIAAEGADEPPRSP